MTTVETEPLIVREGSSLGTEAELDLLFVSDVRDIAYWSNDPDVRETAELLLVEARAEFYEVLAGYPSEDDLDDSVREAEKLLGAIGLCVDWDAGYAIYPRE